MASAVALIAVQRTAEVLARAPAMASNWLSDSEQARLAGLKVPARRDHYLAGHWLVRELLSQAFGEAPTHWQLQERRSLPPLVAGAAGRLRISISHSGAWIAAAVAEGDIGIDIEQRPRLLDASIEALLLNADEAPGSLSQDELLMRWVAKEAWIKCRAGSALPTQLKQLQLHPAPRESADVRIHSHAALHLGLAGDPACAVDWCSAVAMPAGASYSVRVEASPAI